MAMATADGGAANKRRAESDARLEYLYSYISDIAGISRSDLPEYLHNAGLVPKIHAFSAPKSPSALIVYFQKEAPEPGPDPLQALKAKPINPAKQHSSGSGVGGGSHASAKAKPCLIHVDIEKPLLLTGLALYFLRTSTLKGVTEENYNKEIMCGTLDARNPGQDLRYMYKTIENVYIPCLMGISEATSSSLFVTSASSGVSSIGAPTTATLPGLTVDDYEYSELVRATLRKRLIPALRSFCSVLRVWESIQAEYGSLMDSPKVFTGSETIEDLRKIVKTPEKIIVLDSFMKAWTYAVLQIVLESTRLRTDLDCNGPQDEVEYWKRRASRLALLTEKIHSGEMKFTLFCLQLAGSPAVKDWKQLDQQLKFCYTEAKDNAIYIDRIDKICHSLYLDSPVKIRGDVHNLLQTVWMIQTTSMYYTTSERVSHLLIKITNQMIIRCKIHLTSNGRYNVWNQPRNSIRQKIIDCLDLNKSYKKAYKHSFGKLSNGRTGPSRSAASAAPQPGPSTSTGQGNGICISQNFIFGKFNGFCDRLMKLLNIFNTLDNYERLFSTHVCGLLWDDTIEEKEKEFKIHVAQLLTGRTYNHLDYRNKEFDRDYDEFMEKIDGLKHILSKMIERSYHNTWESPQAIKFLKRIEAVTKVVPIATLDDKYERIGAYFATRIAATRKAFQKNKEKDHVPLGMPPVGGKIMWIRSMVLQLEAFTKNFASHDRLKLLPQYRLLVQEYNRFAMEAASFEILILKYWVNEIDLISIEDPLKKPILNIGIMDQPQINLHRKIITLVAECECLVKLGVDIPLPAKILLMKSNHFTNVTDKLSMLLERFERAVRKVERQVRPFLFQQILRLGSIFQPALTVINWTSTLFEGYFKQCLKAIEEFNELVFTTQDTFEYQIQGVFDEMEEILFCSEFTDLPWTLDDLLDRNYKCLRDGATAVHEKSVRLHELVDNLIELIASSGQDIGQKIISQFELEKMNPILGEIMSSTSNLTCMSPNADAENSGSEIPRSDAAGGGGGVGGSVIDGYGSPSSQRSGQTDWSIADQYYENPHLLHGVLSGKCSKEMRELIKTANEDVKHYFSRQVYEVVVRIIKNSLCLLRRRFIGSKGLKSALHSISTLAPVPPGLEESTFTEDTPVFILEAKLQGAVVMIKPTMEQIQESITQVGRAIVAASKGIGQWQVYPAHLAANGNNAEFQSSTFHAVSQKKERRRQLYRSLSQDRIGPPYQPYNYFAMVCDSKEIAKYTSALANCTQIFKESFMDFMQNWDTFDFLWNPFRYAVVKQFRESNPDWVEYEQKLDECKESEQRLQQLSDYYDFGAIRIISEKLKKALLRESHELVLKYGVGLKNRYKREMEFLLLAINDLQKRLETKIIEIDDVRFAMESLQRFRDAEVDLDLRIPPVEEAFFIVTKYNIPVTSDELDDAESLSYLFRKLQFTADQVSEMVYRLHPSFQKQLLENLDSFKEETATFCESYVGEGPMVPGLSPREASDKLAYFQNRFDSLWRRNGQLSSGQQLFGMATTDNVGLSNIKKELNLLQKLYRLYNDVIDRVASYYDILWKDVSIEEINNELVEFQNRCRKLPKGLKEWPAFFALKKTIDDFNDICPLLELMSNKSMKPRHWQRITDITNHEFDLEKETLCLKDILDAPLLQFKEDIEDVCISALKERDIEAKLRQVTNEWSLNELTFIAFKNRGELLLRGDTTAETISQLEDSLMILGSLLSNRYNAPFKKQISKWVSDLSNTNEILERWLLVQNMWVYLEAVFVGGDIAKQLPKEAKRFSKIDYSWQKIMLKAHDTPNTVSCCVGDDLLKQLLPHLQEELEICQKSLSGYLEKKRVLFPRFFFVSDPALLEILGQASDSHTIQSHLLSIFDNIATVKFHETDYNRIIAINSSEGESIKLERPVKAEGSVEIWLGQLLHVSRQSLHTIIREAYITVTEGECNLIEILEELPAQVGILSLQMIWTRDSEAALIQARHDRKIMPEVNNRFLDMLNQLIDQTTRPLSKIDRIKFETFITIHVHQRDIFDTLCRLNVKSTTDFEWAKQCRFYFRQDMDITEIFITDVYFVYQNEYLGATERLVITPLTDRCYITLAQALSLSMGGCPAGPAGTGKTETVKDMGKTLGKYVVVFNCSDQMDYKGLGRIYKGLAQSGSYGCFDEFNRIDLPVLSVASQQIAVVLACRRERKKQFIFTDGELVDLNPEFGIFITMNPGYAGRQELPENLKVQFRTVAMMVPDRQIIIRVKLASCGFLENITLARKFYTLYKLCEEQLTKQVHYDFGLRNILSVLRTLGTAKRANARDAESTIVMRVLRDMNLSKLIDEDEPLFMSLVADLFPNVAFEKTMYPDLQEVIRTQAEQQGLVFHEPWVLKLIQLYETQQVRHGIMTLGPSGAGKTTCIRTLLRALNVETPHREMRMNPKAINAHQMFGRLDMSTNDWTDGVFSALWRKTLRSKKGEHIWLVLDGPVDSLWIENLNSVLDDNKTLTLANGDRLPMSPTCKLIFEPHNIDNASPATVSRNGMVYMSSSGLNWSPIVEAWLKHRDAHLASVLRACVQKAFFPVFDWARQALQFKMPVLECNVVSQLLTLLEGVLPEEDTETTEAREAIRNPLSWTAEKKLPENEIRRIFAFCFAWSIGAFLESQDRIKLDAFLRQEEFELAMPECSSAAGETVFDYLVEGDKWLPWKTKLESFTLPENYINEFASILVPNVDNIRTHYWIDVVSKQGKSVLLIGEQGSAKTLMVDSYTRLHNPELHLSRTMNFSFATTPYQFQKTVESYLEKRVGTTFGPTGGRKMTLFVDDINLPEISEWGDQVTNEIVRQTIEMKGFYNLEKPGEFTHLVDMQFVAAMIHPGAGRNDIPSRLKRHFSVFNCTLPTDKSLDLIFGTISSGHYNAKRMFTEDVRAIVDKLVVLTRLLWQSTRATLLPTPAKFLNIFNLRDLSRIWQGMVGTLSTVIDKPSAAITLWHHEASRVLTDRFSDPKDKEWFDSEIRKLVGGHLGKQYVKLIEGSALFVDFMRDAPEPTGEEGEDADVELPKVYEPIDDYAILKDRLAMFLTQYNEIVRGSPMNLVFFPDAMMNLVRISRILRNPGGNALLVGVGGSGKQSLTKLSSFIAGYKTFQITLTRSYNLSNFLEDLKLLYRTCGGQGKGTTFIFSDQDMKEEVFLEYLNNVLASGLICNLFNRDEHAEIIAELTPIMRREMPKKSATPEGVFNHFIQRMKQNLHVVLCCSPVGEKFRNRALKFPALISGCTINWFTPWPKDALIAVAEHFLKDFPMECSPAAKSNTIFVLGSIQDSVSNICAEYFQRLRRSAHVTPKSYLNFLSSYKTIYSNKLNQIKDSANRMDMGLLKLKEAAISVGKLKAQLSKMDEELDRATKEAERVLASVKERAEEAEGIRNRVQSSKDIAETLVIDIEADRKLAEEKLEAARPALEEAEAALNTIQPAHIATVRKLGRPPHLIMRIMDCVLILFQRKLHLSFPDPQSPCPRPSWAEALKMMASTTFLLQLQNFPKDTINEETVELLEPYFRMDDYNMDDAKRVCGDVAGLLSWTKAMAFFFGVNKEVLPLKANLALQEGRLRVAVNDLARLEAELLEKETELEVVKQEYNTALGKTEQLMQEAEICRKKMSAAMALIEGLSGENRRWTEQSKEFKGKMGRLVGDVLNATAFLAYSGPFNQEYRATLAKQWRALVSEHDLPRTLQGFTVLSLLADTAQISDWMLQGLPKDELSIENAVIAVNGACYPLLVDPQSQGKSWIKAKEAQNNLLVTSLNHKYFRTYLEDSLSLGRPLLVEDVGEELDPVLDNVLEKNFIKSGTIEKVMVGDKECDVMPGFMLYITTKLGNPFYTPEISAKTSIIDFTVTMRGLEDQLLGRVILMEKSDLESERLALFESVMQNQRSMQILEDNLLIKLSTSKGSLVDDEELIRVLRETKSTAEEVKTKLQVSEETEQKITIARDEFRPIASRGSILYFLVVEMAKVNFMYQTSLKQFLNLFDSSIKNSPKGGTTEERIAAVLHRLNLEVWQFVQRLLFEKDRFLFTLLMVLKIHLHEQKISHEEFMVLIKGGASLDLTAVPPKPFKWISDIAWLNLVELSKLQQFEGILEQVRASEQEWKMWFDMPAPEAAPLPCGYEAADMDSFRRLLMIRCWCPDRTLSQAKIYVTQSLGSVFGETKILDLEQTLQESDERTPLICILSTGSDPTNEIEALAKSKGTPIRVASMGQGQEAFARQLILDSCANGSWTLLQNCHLCLPFCDEIMELLSESNSVSPNFRLWLTTEGHSSFPIGLLHASIKFTNEAPQGIRASMKRTYQGVTQDYLDYTGSKHWPVLLYTVAFLHTVVQERRKFGALGWNVPYEFNKADFTASVQFIQNHLEELNPRKQIVSWQTVCYMLGEVQYGGRVTDDFDKRLLNTFTSSWFSEPLLHGHFEFYKGYRALGTRNLNVIQDIINNLPIVDSPEVFGLHPNADITYQINGVKSIFEAILAVQPKQSGGGAGESRESVVHCLAEDMLAKLPPPYISFEIKDALSKLGALLPMNIFLRQELDRMQRVLLVVRETLCDLQLAIEGTIIMSATLREALDAMYDAQVPPSWKRISWDSSSIGFWFTELLDRYAQFQLWLSKGKPVTFWLTGFFNPQGFLTAMRQEVTRAHKGWALDSVVLQNVVTRFWKEEITEGPAEGVYVHGLFIEGASVEKRSGRLVESKPKILYEPVPVIFIFAVNTTFGKDPRLYECPIYRKPKRSDVNYIGSIDFQTDVTPRHWILRGVALLCDIK